MNYRLHKTVILLFVFLLFAMSVNGQESRINSYKKLVETAQKIVQDPLLRFGEWGCYATDITTGETILDINGNKSLAPASNLKLFTTAAALSQFGPSHRFVTLVGYSGQIKDNILMGDLIIVGGGDPTLGSTTVKGNPDLDQVIEKIISSVKKAGIKRIEGQIVADISYFDQISVPDGWLWVDIGNYYGAGPSALCCYDNLYHLFFKPGNKVGDSALVLFTKPEIPNLKFRNFMKTGPVRSGDNGYIYGASGGNTRLLRGTIPAGVKQFSIKGSIPNPALFFVQLLKEQLTGRGVDVLKDAEVSPQSIQLAGQLMRIESPLLSDIIYWINKKSINLYTEVLLKHLGKSRYETGSFEHGLKALKNFLIENGIPPEGMFLFDGSGLSPQNAITTKQMVIFLHRMTESPYFEDFYNSFPIAGSDSDDGQLGYLCRGTSAAKNLRAKTGMIGRVRAHSGYVKTLSGKLICFSMIANDHIGSVRMIDRLHEKLMIQLAELE